MLDKHLDGIAVRQQGGGEAFFGHFTHITPVAQGRYDDLGSVAHLHLGDFVFGDGDFHRQAIGVDDAHDGLQRGDVLTQLGVEAADCAAERCCNGVVGKHGVGEVDGRLGLFEVGNHLTPFDFGQAAVVVHFFQAVVGVLGLFHGGLRRASGALHLRRRHTCQHLSFAHRAAFSHIK